jgi:glycosyltransferase involved in cell wall biosynthesis
MTSLPSSSAKQTLHVSVIGSVGVPAQYGGFETLVENLAIAVPQMASDIALTIYCSAKTYPERTPSFRGARLRHVPLNANGAQSIPYDIWSLASAVFSRADVVLVLGVSGALAIPMFRLLGRSRIVTNVDGIEWKREKWKGLSRWILRVSEWLAVKYSHAVIADNDHIAAHIRESYGVACETIPYGGDHACLPQEATTGLGNLPDGYGLTICRIEPENNIRMIVEVFVRAEAPLVIVGNWNASTYGQKIKDEFGQLPQLRLLDPIYDLSILKALRNLARFYVHGHSAGGTNPSLIEAMHFHRDILAFDCGFNRATTENRALYFQDSAGLGALLSALDAGKMVIPEGVMKEIAERRYTWAVVARQYFDLMRRVAPVRRS